MDVHKSHFHAWTESSMRAMLRAARPLLHEQPFEILDVITARRTPFQMQELHVALRRL